MEQYVQALHHLRDEQGHALVVRNGKSHHERTVQLGAGSIQIRAPRAHDRRPDKRFTSRILPPYMRRSPRLEEALPVLYLRGLSTADFSEALEALLGPQAAGFSATTITRLLKVWQEEYDIWHKRSLQGLIFQLNTGFTYGRPIPSSPCLPLSKLEPRSPKALAPARPVWPWPSSCYWPLNNVGAVSMHHITDPAGSTGWSLSLKLV